MNRPHLLACWAAFVAALAAGCVPPPAASPPEPTSDRSGSPTVPASPLPSLPVLARDTVQRHAREMTVRIRNTGCRTLATGSGFLLSPQVVVTNRHVVEGAVSLQLNTWDGRSVEAAVRTVARGTDDDLDLAIIRLEEPVRGSEAAQFAEVEPGERVAAVGYPGGGPLEIATGEVLAVEEGTVFGPDTRVVRLSSSIIPGNSGGPVINAAGQVVAVVFGVDQNRGDGLAIAAGDLLAWLEAGAFSAPSAGCAASGDQVDAG